MKRAQIPLGETFFAVVIVIFLIVIGIVFYAGAQERQTDIQQNFLQDLDAIAMSKYMEQLTEIKCSTLEVQQANCLDIYKLEALQAFSEAEPETFATYYFTQLQNAQLVIRQIYPNTGEYWVLYNNTLIVEDPDNTDAPQPLFDTAVSFIPVSLHNPITNRQSFGVLELTLFQRP